ncbi:MAG: M28 family peptidase [Flavobacteriales bacterium]
MRIAPVVPMVLSCAWQVAGAQADTLARFYAGSITGDELRGHVEVLASDSFMGRETSKEGQRMAARYLREAFVSYGIPPVVSPSVTEGYYQRYELVEERAGAIEVRGRGRRLAYPDEALYMREVLSGPIEVRQLTVIVDADADPPGSRHALLVLDGAADEQLKGLRARLLALQAQRWDAVFVAMADEAFDSLRDLAHPGGSRMRLAEEAGAQPPRSLGPQVIMVPRRHLGRLLGRRGARRADAAKHGRLLKTRIALVPQPRSERVVAENVLAYIEGSDLKHELVVITAHYDHIGAEDGEVFNGADDNASGTAALLEIAQAFATAKRHGHGPRRSVLVMPVSGEEKGLLGSRHYSEHPVFPLEATVADLNIDMIGRTDSAHADAAPYIYIIGSDRLSTELHAVNEQANDRHVGLALDYRFNAEDDPNRFYYRSDHYNFARKGVPSIFYFSGVHEDYHRAGDDAWKIRYDLMVPRARLVFHTAWELANRPMRLKVDR